MQGWYIGKYSNVIYYINRLKENKSYPSNGYMAGYFPHSPHIQGTPANQQEKDSNFNWKKKTEAMHKKFT